MKKVNFLGVLSASLMFIAVFLPWKTLKVSSSFNITGMAASATNLSYNISGFHYTFGYLAAILSFLGIFLSYKKIKFSFIIGIINIIIGVSSIFNWVLPNGANGQNIDFLSLKSSSSGAYGGYSAETNFETSFGLYLLITASVLFLTFEFISSFSQLSQTTADDFAYNNSDKSNKSFKNIGITLLGLVLLLVGLYFFINYNKTINIPKESLWNIITEYKENEQATLNKYVGKKIQISGWLREKSKTNEGDFELYLNGATQKNGEHYLMSAGKDNPAKNITNYNGFAICKLERDTDNFKYYKENEGFFQDITVEGIITKFEKESKDYNFLGMLVNVVNYKVKLEKCKVINVNEIISTNVEESKIKSKEVKTEDDEIIQNNIDKNNFTPLLGEYLYKGESCYGKLILLNTKGTLTFSFSMYDDLIYANNEVIINNENGIVNLVLDKLNAVFDNGNIIINNVDTSIPNKPMEIYLCNDSELIFKKQ